METINQIINFADAMFERFPKQKLPIDSTAFAASLIVLIVLSTAPWRFVAIFGAALLALLGFLILIEPNYAVILFIIGCGLVSLMRSRHRSAIMQQQLDKLGRTLHELQSGENPRLILSLNSPPPSGCLINQIEAPSIMSSDTPTAKDGLPHDTEES